MKTWYNIALTAALLAGSTSGVQADPQTPTQVVNEFYTMIIAGNTPYGSSDNYPQLSRELRELLAEVNKYPFPYCMDFDPWGGAQVGIDKYAVISGDSRGDSAVLKVKAHRYGCEGYNSSVMVNVFLQKEDGAWKITNFVVPQEQIDLRMILKEKIVEYAEDKNKGTAE